MSKMAAVGIGRFGVLAAANARPARLLRGHGWGTAAEFGTLEAGGCADICVLDWQEGGEMEDCHGHRRRGGMFIPLLAVKAG